MFSRIKLPSLKRNKNETSVDKENEELAKKLKPFRKELTKYLDNSESTYNLSAQFTNQLSIDSGERNANYNAVLRKLPKGLDEKNLLFMGTNNFNMKVNTTNAAVIVQGIVLDQNQIDAIDRLIGSGAATFLPAIYGDPLFSREKISAYQAALYSKTEALNPNTTIEGHRKNFVVNCIEQFPINFKDKVQNAVQISPDNIYLETADIAAQLSRMLTILSAGGIVWTDMKPGNILARADGSLAVADLKAFADINTIYLSKKGNRDIGCNWNANCTGTFTSPAGNIRLFSYKPDNPYFGDHSAEARAYFFKEWQKEYSYQMGATLYVALSGRFTEEELLSGRQITFDYDLPVFATPQGQEYKAILEALTHPDPDQRLSYTEAATMLQTIANQAQVMPEQFCHQSYKERLTDMKSPPSDNLEEQGIRIK